ncbi:hypothetical protein [Paenibacillus caui]|uniref:hypothetical protein n=1 Tax=Paenibacillus caui TaxID=2873927 RepID=UPI001CA7BF89|nr:hypothetical protein [Paenibacillus caui]
MSPALGVVPSGYFQLIVVAAEEMLEKLENINNRLNNGVFIKTDGKFQIDFYYFPSYTRFNHNLSLGLSLEGYETALTLSKFQKTTASIPAKKDSKSWSSFSSVASPIWDKNDTIIGYMSFFSIESNTDHAEPFIELLSRMLTIKMTTKHQSASEAEKQLIKLLGQGKTDLEIASSLMIEHFAVI